MFDSMVRTLKVRHAPNIKKNLISLSLLDKKGYKLGGQDGVFKIRPYEQDMDDKTRGCPRLAEIGGALRDNSGCVKIIFSKSLGVADLNLAEITSIKEAFLLFAAFPWALSHELTVESNSFKVVKWCNDSPSAPWRMKSLLNFTNSMKRKILK
ncbi:Uncharacterized protein TCM_012118 [Theobroma cacao]|uniref:RNase H type-1 domain-containing protein n=1 Tax=Theobroma cacao TaxID=3641 RepID=A0A061FUN9_THECC|nr:Uncharacterized protein TCM_012118 [Theobroma cacao]